MVSESWRYCGSRDRDKSLLDAFEVFRREQVCEGDPVSAFMSSWQYEMFATDSALDAVVAQRLKDAKTER